MADALVSYLRQKLPPEVVSQVESHIRKLEQGDLEGLLRSSEARNIFGHEQTETLENVKIDDFPDWNDFIFQRLSVFLADRSSQDAIAGLKKHILDWGVTKEDELKAIDKAAKEEVDHAVEEAKQSPAPDLEQFWKDIYVSVQSWLYGLG